MRNEIRPISIGNVTISPDHIAVIAGPCAIESRDQIFRISKHVTRGGADLIRGGAYKPRTNPDAFQGLGEEGLRHIFDAGRELDVPVVTEVMSEHQIRQIIDTAEGHPFMFQVGSRNAQNYSLLRSVGQTGVPVLLKNGKGSTVSEMLGAARYVTSGGSPVIMCERGIVTFDSGDPAKGAGRFTPNLLAILRFQEEGFITLFDPSHSAGRSDHVVQLALSGVAIGASGIIVEVHDRPCEALCDANQAIDFAQFDKLMHQARAIEKTIRGSAGE